MTIKTEDQRQAAFEAWHKERFGHIPLWVEEDSEYILSSVQLRFEAYQAALQSLEVEALRKDSQRLSAIESDEGADIIRLSSDEWEVSGYEKNLYGTGRTLREAIDNAIKEA